MAMTARSAGMPQDQLERFLSFGYVPQPRQMQFHAACREADHIPLSIGFGGARGGSKTHGVFAQITLDDCQRAEGLKGLFLRKVAKSARESMQDLRRKVLHSCKHNFKEQAGMLVFDNESHIICGHFNYEKDIDHYLGLEYDFIAIEEATQLSETKRNDILTCLRTSRDDWRPRDYNTTNPGGVGHEWFKRIFIKPYQERKQTRTRFIPSTVYDNKMVDTDYRSKLENLTGWKREAWLEGDFDIMAGQFFGNFQHSTHVVKPFPIPEHWPIWAALDYGYNHPTVAYVFTMADGIIYVIAEYWKRQQLPKANAEGIAKICATVEIAHPTTEVTPLKIEKLDPFVAGADVFAQRGHEGGKTIAAQYKEFGIDLKQANTDRISGASQLLNLLGDIDADIPPKIKIFNTCGRLIDQLPAMQHDPHRPEDVLKVDIDEDGNGGDDCYDTVRYGVMVKYKGERPQTEAERREAKLPLALQNVPQIIAQQGEEYAERAILARAVAMTEIENKEKPARANAAKYRPMVPRLPGRGGRR